MVFNRPQNNKEKQGQYCKIAVLFNIVGLLINWCFISPQHAGFHYGTHGTARQQAAFFLFQPRNYCDNIEIDMATVVGTIPKPVRKDAFGVLRVGRTRVSLDSVVYAFNQGEDAAEIGRNFDSLTLAEIHSAIAYYLHNKEKVDAYLAEQDREFEKKRLQNLKDFPPCLTREMLTARENGLDPDWNK